MVESSENPVKNSTSEIIKELFHNGGLFGQLGYGALGRCFLG